jgi:hypothetical protein
LPDLLQVTLPGLTEPNPMPLVAETSGEAPMVQVYLSPKEMPEDLSEQAKRFYEIFSTYPDIKDWKIPADPWSVVRPDRLRHSWQVALEWPSPMMWTNLSDDEKAAWFDKIAPEYRYREDRFARPQVAGKRPPSCLMTWWLLLYSCSIIARYQPRKWTALLDLDSSASAVALQYLLEEAISAVPHLVLDALDREPWLLTKPLAFLPNHA